MDKDLIKNILIQENYPSHMIDKTIEKLENLQPDISNIFNSWLLNGNEPTLLVEGYSYTSLVKDFGMKPIGAFLTMDWLLREPEKAVGALKRGIR